jgi:hypothetical protein
MKRFFIAIFILLALAGNANAAGVCFNATEIDLVNATSFCSLQQQFGAGTNESRWELRCTALTQGFVTGIVPSGTSNTFRAKFTYATNDTSGTDVCKAAVSVMSMKGSCNAAATNPGVACDSGSSTCTGGSGACTGAPPLDVYSTNFLAATNTITNHVSGQAYTTAWTSTAIVQRYDVNAAVTTNCAGSECNFQTAKVFVQLYSSGSNASRCDYIQFCLDFQ